MVEEEDGLNLGLRVLMMGFEGMRVHNDDPVHHMRVGKQGNPSPVQDEYQGQDELYDAA